MERHNLEIPKRLHIVSAIGAVYIIIQSIRCSYKTARVADRTVIRTVVVVVLVVVVVVVV